MRIFVCEYVTGGGLYREPLPASLAREGDLMLGALLADLSDLAQVDVLTTRDARLPPLSGPVEVVEVADGGDVWQLWEECLQRADALWPIAPESGGVLERLSRLAVRHGKRLLGCAPQAVALAASKHQTAAALAARHVPAVPTFRPLDMPSWPDGPWVAKPDNGAGCEDTRCFSGRQALMAWLAEGGRMESHVVQPFVAGEPASLSIICHDGQARLLACNRQLVALRQGEFNYRGSVLNGLAQHWTKLERLARSVANAIPGLTGYAGIDFMLHEGAATVIEVNPRLTTSYAGLRRAIGCNPARLVLDLIYNDAFLSFPDLERNVVNISLDE